jgi:hypothetical protein
MSDETNAVDGATPAAPANPATPAAPQETPATPANAEQGQEQNADGEQARDEKGRFVQERINDLTRKWRSTERERDDLARQLRETQSQRQQAAPSEKEPALEDFADINEWSRAMTAHAVKVAESRVEARFSQQTQQSSQQQLAEKFAAREREYATANPTYIEAVQSLGSVVQFTNEQLEVIGSSDHGPALVHHLATHLDEAVRIAHLPAHLAARELALLEVKVSAPKAKPVSAAPSPTPVLGGGSVPQTKDPDSMSVEEWTAWRNKQLKK